MREVLAMGLCSTPAVWSAWVVSRLFLAWLILVERGPIGDVMYYFLGVYGDDPTAMTEYPWFGAWPSELLARFIGEHMQAYIIAFVVMIMLADAVFFSLLLRRPVRWRTGAAWWWVCFGAATGHVFILRLDLFPAVAVGGAVWAFFAVPLWAGVFLGAATMMKLWPGVLAVSLVGRWGSRQTWQRLVAFLATMAALCLVAIVVAGPQRLLSPLDYQTVRGLQVESVAATWAMVQHWNDPQQWVTSYAQSKSFEVTGPGVDTALAVSSWAMIAVVLTAVLWALVRTRNGQWTPHAATAIVLFLIAGLLLANKVFSTQYIVWVGPMLAVALTRDGWTRGQRRLLWACAGVALVCAGLGMQIYPFGYAQLMMGAPQGPGSVFPIVALVLRNVLIVMLTLLSAALVYSTLRTPAPHGSSPDSQTTPLRVNN
ncbi:glycosyltransferase family 87 protein [Corynebacterium lizhenjunii]|uniref:glycosyltransferase family 87 protein n=1 Tax=Corynebacterium lizhenjunii TaxID=2709394 RepID=UPI001F37821B|nr:glycosyltransferase family 87 protein [Corynebacterium lizhenjunii]